ncbi:MAG: RNA 2'-phosphotransferase [Caldilineaceae bacterium]
MPNKQPDRFTRISKFLSLVLRHQPDKIGITLDKAGWVAVTELLRACQQHGFPITLEELKTVVATSDKQRFAFSEDGTRIRANQGHSVDVELGYQPVTPPAMLYHGTAERFLPSIQQQGLVKGQRHHVHLSADEATAQKVGARHGKPVVLQVQSGLMHRAGCLFYQSENGVWLTAHVPVAYLVLPTP